MYCPYCNKHDCHEMTDEHVIPRSIGGGDDTVISVCKACNSTIGAEVDSLMARHSGMRFIALGHGKASRGPHRQEKHCSYGTLNDGTRLKGYAHVEWEDDVTVNFVFQPIGTQEDGKIWMTEVQLKGNTGPPDVRILEPGEIKNTAFIFTSGQGEGLEPGMFKIILGIRYLADGERLVGRPSFDLIRNSIRDSINSSIIIEWIDPKKNPDLLPLACGNNQHLIWESCPDGDQYHAGVCLFGRFCMTISISNFGIAIAPADCQITLPWLQPQQPKSPP